jgi:deoxyguanosine kinase
MKEVSKRLNGGNFYRDSSTAFLISLAGVIGAGKTTLAKAVSNRLDCPLIREAYDTNPYVEEVFEGNSDKALDCQLYFLKSRADQLNKERLDKHEPMVSDYVFDKELIYSSRMLSQEQKAEYDKHYRSVVNKVTEPVVTIYLRVNPDVCLERIDKRNRDYEKQIDLAMLKGLFADYEELFSNWKKSPLITLEGDKFDVFDAGQVEDLVKQVKMYI